MKHIKNSFAAFIGLLVIVTAVTALIPALTRGQKSDAAPQPPTLDVKVVNSTSEPVPIAGTINVGNLVSNPLPVRDVDNPARQPVQGAATCSVFEGGSCQRAIYVVPAGKRLVIEYASMEAHVSDNRTPRMWIYTAIGGHEIRHFLPIPPPVPGLGLTTSIGQQVRLYADPGTGVGVSGVVDDSSGTAVFKFNIYGYLVDVQ